MKISRQMRINLYEIVMMIGLIVGGAVIAQHVIIGVLFIMLGVFSYMQLGYIVSKGKAVPFYRRKQPTNYLEELDKERGKK
ncbi:hypothetical protein CMI37_29835 [Candidatus Pacearchaeota archaeon]|nr:hypothetical protein [Candidatus Pacearchaeota archaeon]|tara:strand:+ start:117 stop:359 length:243 start_codon:yes stop_codon:yes gene_type:complete